jgi:hypothetical protein
MKSGSFHFVGAADTKIDLGGPGIYSLPRTIGNQEGAIPSAVDKLHNSGFANKHWPNSWARHHLVLSLGPFAPDDFMDMGQRTEIVKGPPHKGMEVSQVALY